MATKLPAKDVVVIGLGWTGAILAHELTDRGLDVVAIERGPWRDTAASFNIGYAPDELRHGVRLDLFQEPAQGTLTFHNSDRETALPIRQCKSTTCESTTIAGGEELTAPLRGHVLTVAVIAAGCRSI
jgi:gluconate 2-dehydrogenase alpha chain